jgi:hypothetical protein
MYVTTMMSKRSNLIWTVLLVLLAATLMTTTTRAEEASPKVDIDDAPPSNNQDETPTVPTFNAEDHTDWGHYYDPKNIFCGKYDCYSILGFDFEHFGAPETKEVTKRYRQLSRAWHPDKSKHKDAKERFVVSGSLFMLYPE